MNAVLIRPNSEIPNQQIKSTIKTRSSDAFVLYAEKEGGR
jgi:hypothetical protein